MERRIPIGPIIGAIGAVTVIVSLVLDWYEGLTGFTVFEALDLVLVLLALATVVSLAGEVGLRVPGLASPPAGRALLFATAAAVVVVSQLLNDPPAVVAEFGPEKDLGIWLALAGSALMVAGAALTGTQISLAVDVQGRAPAPAPGRDPAGERRSAADPAAPTSERPTVVDRPGKPPESPPPTEGTARP